MTHGLLASNDYGVVVSADLKNYVFVDYIPAPVPSGGLYSFTTPGNAASIYGVRLPIGGQGAVISAVAIAGGVRVTVIGEGVLGLLVFSPITSGGVSDCGMALFDSVGQCTFDSTQKHLVVGAAGNIYPNGEMLVSSSDTAIYVGAGIYPAQTTNTESRILNGTTTYQPYPSGTAWTYTRVVYIKATVSWLVDRAVVVRGSGAFSGAKVRHTAGSYAYTYGAQYQRRYIQVFNSGGGTDTGWRAYSGDAGTATKWAQEQAIIAEERVGQLSINNQYPYALSSYNTTQNAALITDSSLYL